MIKVGCCNLVTFPPPSLSSLRKWKITLCGHLCDTIERPYTLHKLFRWDYSRLQYHHHHIPDYSRQFKYLKQLLKLDATSLDTRDLWLALNDLSSPLFMQ